MDQQTSQALKAFTQRYCDAWHQQHDSWPQSEALFGIPSTCIISSINEHVVWQPQPFDEDAGLQAVERALDIVVQPAAQAFYTTQYAGDMGGRFDGESVTLLQTWSADDFQRVQENLIGHLVTQKRLKLSPTLFIATLESELDVISVCNLSGEVVRETLGTSQRTVLAASLAEYLNVLEPVL